VPVAITTPPSLAAADQSEIRALATAIEDEDGAPPLSDQGSIQLGSGRVRHVLARADGRIVGYAQLDSAIAAVPALEVLAQPEALDPLLDAVETDTAALDIWAHGQRSRLVAVAERRGYTRARVLWQLRWPVRELPPVALYEGVTLRAFVPGQDESAWLAVNAAAFAHHPEQGGWTLADIQAREAEPWFDPAGFLLAEQGGAVIGFHWTKVHSQQLGEVYVLCVDPKAQRMHLGTALLLAGLAHLRAGGITEVLLYVDESNTSAMTLYEHYGFTRFDSDVRYRYSHPLAAV
jgi:mycothiol synthase